MTNATALHIKGSLYCNAVTDVMVKGSLYYQTPPQVKNVYNLVDTDWFLIRHTIQIGKMRKGE